MDYRLSYLTSKGTAAFELRFEMRATTTTSMVDPQRFEDVDSSTIKLIECLKSKNDRLVFVESF